MAGETTPLLREGDEEASASGDQSSDAPVASETIPKMQVALLCFARLIEPIAFFSVFPYINQMVQDNGGVADTDVGFYSGVIESLFSLMQALVMLAWGRASDRVGRKPVLVVSLAGLAAATALFGLARTLGEMIAFRCLAGVFAGTVVTIRTMLAEHSTAGTQARVFSWFAFSGNLGIFLGPLFGGALAGVGDGDGAGGPGKSGLLASFPYALPGLVIGGMSVVAAVLSALFVEETLVRRARPAAGREEQDGHDGADVQDGEDAQDTSVRGLLHAPGVGIVLYVYAHIMLLAFAYTALVPLFWFTPVRLGGLGLTKVQIALMMAVSGGGQALWLLFVFPPLQHRVGTNGVMRLCAAAYPFFMALPPLAALLLRAPLPLFFGLLASEHARRVLFWTATPTLMAVGCGVSMCFTAVQLAVNDVAPSPQLLGTLNALALTGVSVTRAFTPALFTSLFAVGARSQLLGGYAIWGLMVLLAAGYTVAVRYLPDYEALKKQRIERS